MAKKDPREIYQEYKKKQQGKETSTSKHKDPRDIYKAYKVKKSYENGTLNDDINAFVGRVNTYSDNYNKYISDYNDRFVKSDSDGEEATDEYFYRTGDDAAQWAKSATDRKAQLEGESSAILSELEFYKPYVSEEWYNEIANYFNGHGDTMGSIVDVATKDNAYWSKWENEDEYKDSWYYSKFNKKYAGIDSLEGWEAAYDDYAARINGIYNSQLSNTGIHRESNIELSEALGISNVELSETDAREGEYLTKLKEYLDVKYYDPVEGQKTIDSYQTKVDEWEEAVNGRSRVELDIYDIEQELEYWETDPAKRAQLEADLASKKETLARYIHIINTYDGWSIKKD